MKRHWLKASCSNTNLIRRTRDFRHLAMSAMSAMVALWLFFVSVSPVAAELQPLEPLEPLEDGCLLQTSKEGKVMQPAVDGYEVTTCGNPPASQTCICRVTNPRPPPQWRGTIGSCAVLCSSSPGFQWIPAGRAACFCCDAPLEVRPADLGWVYVPDAGAVGDPHITTLDGKRYTLLSQGTFSLWHFSGLETELHSEEVAGTQVDWQVYAHYSGQQSFTKGLLLMDKTGGSIRQVLEITSQDCKWKARKGNEDWKVVDNAELISVPDGKEYLTGFDLSTVTGPPGHGGHGFPNRVHFNMNTKNGKSAIAVMGLSCRPSHNMNVLISMKRQSDQQFVDGELKVARKSLSMLQTSTDSEFSIDSKWQELGGSEQAASYFQLVDTHQTSIALQSQGCSDAEKGRAKETCSKHLGEAHGIENTHFFEDCVYDVCHGAGETQAELAAELLAVTKAE